MFFVFKRSKKRLNHHHPCDENTPPGQICRDEGDFDSCDRGFIDSGRGCEPNEWELGKTLSDHESIDMNGSYIRKDAEDQIIIELDPNDYRLRGLVTNPFALDNPHTRKTIKQNIRMTKVNYRNVHNVRSQSFFIITFFFSRYAVTFLCS